MSQKVIFKYGNESNIPSTKEPGQLLFAIKSDGTGNIYFDKDASTRIKMGLGTEGGTINGTLLFQNAKKEGHLKLYGSDEGGNIQIQGPNNTHYWEMDALHDNHLRLYCYDINKNEIYGYWSLSSDKSTLFPGKIQAPNAHFTSSNDALETANKDVALRLGAENGAHLDLDDNEIIAKNDAATMGTLHLQGLKITEGGNIIEGTWNGSPIAIDKGGTGATTAAGVRAALEVPHFKDGIINLNNLEGIGTSKDDGQWLKIWNLEHTASDGTKSYPAGLVPTKDGVQVLGTSAYKFKSIYALSFAGGVWNGNTITIDKGGTGATTAAGARTNLGVMSKTGDSATGNYTFSGKITLLNPSSSGNISLWADSEGGNLSIQSKSGTYSYQMDGNFDSFLRLISFKGSSHISDWYFYAESGLFESPSIQTGNLVVSAGHKYPGTSLKKTSDNREVGYGGAIADDTTYAQITYKGKDGYTEYYLMPAYTEGKGKNYWYDIYTSKNLKVGGRNLLKCLPLSKMPFGTGDSSGSDTKGTVSYDAYSKSLCVANNKSNLRLWLRSGMPIRAGETYTISCWTYSETQDSTAGEPYQFQITVLLNSGSKIYYSKDSTDFKSFYHADTSGNGWGWRVISQTFTAPADSATADIAFRTGYDYQNYTNKFYVKNFKIEQSPVYTDWCPAPEELLTVEGGSTYESLQIGTGKTRHLNLWAGDDGHTKIGHQDASWSETNAIYLYDTHTYFKRPLQIISEQFWESSGDGNKYGIDMRNSDIMNASGIYFQDDANAMGEGLNFYRGTNTWDSLLASGGKLYFAPNRAKNSVGTRYEVYHSGGATIPISKGGTGATTAADARKNLAVPYYAKYDAGNLQTGAGNGSAWITYYGDDGTSYNQMDLGKTATSFYKPVNVASGGTGATTFTSGQALIGNGTNGITTRAITDNTAVGALISSSSWTSNNSNLVTLNTLAFWNGAHAGNNSNLSKLGTVTSGTWKASTIAVAYGGTGATSASGACTNLGAVKKSGDAMTGQLSISHNSFHTLKLIASSSNTTKEASIGFFQDTTEAWTLGVATGSNGTTDFGLYAAGHGLAFKVGKASSDPITLYRHLNSTTSGNFGNSLQVGSNAKRQVLLYSGDDHAKISSQNASWFEYNAMYMYDTHTYFKKPITVLTEQYWTDGKYGVDVANSDIINANGIYFKDDSNTAGEGINFYRSSTTWDTLVASGGKLYFAPNRATSEVGTRYEVYHSGDKTTARRGIIEAQGVPHGTDVLSLDIGIHSCPNESYTPHNYPVDIWSPIAVVSGHKNYNDIASDGYPTGVWSIMLFDWEGGIWTRRRKWDTWGNWIRLHDTQKAIAIGDGGTGATTASGARANLGALSNAGDTANGNYTINGSLTIQNTNTQKISLNNTNANSESSIGFHNAGTLKWVLGIGCGGSGNTFALWNNNLGRNDITVDNRNGETAFTGAIIAKNNSSSGYAKMWNDGEGGNIQIRSKSGTYDYQWDAYQDNHMRFFAQNTAGSVIASWNYWPHSGCFATKAININGTGDITGITYSDSAPAGSAGHIWLKPI